MFKRQTLISFIKLQFWWSLLFWQNSAIGINIQKRINPLAEVLKVTIKEPPVGVFNSSLHIKDYVQEMWLPQKLDHFADTTDGNANETWMMRYYMNSDFHEEGGPLFIMVGGEWEIQSYLLQQGHFYDMAQHQGALMFYTEHRYYGKSWPKNSASVDDLKYLNVRQSLEDLRNFIEYQKSSRNLQDSKVVLVGGSYAGSMVAWFMKLYPDLAEVAWASSAPLEAKMDFYEFMTLTMQSIRKKGGSRCADRLEKGFQDLRRMLLSSSSSSDELLQRLQMCTDFDATNEMNVGALFHSLGNYFAALVQNPGSKVTKFCQRFLSSVYSNPGEALMKYIREVFLPYAGGEEEYDDEDNDKRGNGGEWCLDLSYEGMKSIFSEYDDIYTGTRCWFYQTCHEFGWFATTRTFAAFSSTSFAGQVPLKFFQRLCQDVFQSDAVAGEDESSADVAVHILQPPTLQELHSRAKAINRIFGGITNVSQRVIFTHGRLDPWRAAGLQRGQNVLFLEGYSHVEDLGSIDLSDTVEMNVAKLKVSAFINKALRN